MYVTSFKERSVWVLSKAVSKTLNLSSKAVGVKAFGFKEEQLSVVSGYIHTQLCSVRSKAILTNRRFVQVRSSGVPSSYVHTHTALLSTQTLRSLNEVKCLVLQIYDLYKYVIHRYKSKIYMSLLTYMTNLYSSRSKRRSTYVPRSTSLGIFWKPALPGGLTYVHYETCVTLITMSLKGVQLGTAISKAKHFVLGDVLIKAKPNTSFWVLRNESDKSDKSDILTQLCCVSTFDLLTPRASLI